MANEPPDLPLQLPHAESALVQQAKLCDYLLSTTHPIGRFKAAFFASLGYTARNWEQLRSDLLRLARTGSVLPGQLSPYGQKYEVRGTLVGPQGRRANVVTVWIVLSGEAYPLFVTAFPGE